MFVVLYFVMVMLVYPCDVFTHVGQGCFTSTGSNHTIFFSAREATLNNTGKSDKYGITAKHNAFI